MVPSLYYKPKDASPGQRVPALVEVHGGPGGQSMHGYSAQIQYLVDHGYAVLRVNNRGSSGYGKSYFIADDRKHGRELAAVPRHGDPPAAAGDPGRQRPARN